MSKKVRRLFAGFVPKNYQLELDPDRATMRLRGSVTITGRKQGRPSQRLTFHQHDLKITKASMVRRDKKGERAIAVSRINHQRKLDEVRLHTDELLYAGDFEVRLEFETKITDAMHGIYPCYYELDGQKTALIASQFESNHAREAFPCIDEPEAKATFDLTVLAPKDETALGNTPVKTKTPRGDKTATTFQTTPVMSTYLLAFVYGDLQCREAQTSAGVDVRVWSTKIHSLESLDFGLDVAKRSIEFFDDYFGVPYPLPKADHVALPDFSVGAMENWGLVTYREVCLIAEPDTVSQSSRELVATVITHETSHQWFGNLVTMRWWDNLWLNESFANVMEYRAVDALFPEWHIWNTFITQEGLSAIRRDAITGVQAVQTEVNHPDEINSLFDPSIVYAKGGRLLRMLMEYIGETDFRKGLKAYFEKHAYGNTTGDDLWQALSTASGKPIAALMNPWLTRAGFPVVEVAQESHELQLSQKHFALDPAKADPDRHWPIPLLSGRADVPSLLETASAQAKLTTDEFVRINQGALGHYIVNYTRPAHVAAIAGLVKSQKLGPAERLMLLSDSSMLARANQHSFAETLRLLENYQQEDTEPVWDIMALILADARRFIDRDEQLEPKIKQLIRRLIEQQFKRLGWRERPGEPVQDTKLRATITALGIYAEHPAITDEAVQLFAAYQKEAGAVPSELRSIVFSAAIRSKVANAFESLLELHDSTNNGDLKHDISSALTDTRDPKQAARLLQRLKDADKVRPQDVMRWAAYLMRNRHTRSQAWQWLRDEWDWIEETFGSDKSYDAFPRYAANCFNTHASAKEYRQFFEPKQSDLSLSRNIALGIEELETRMNWLDRDLPQIQQYFS